MHETSLKCFSGLTTLAVPGKLLARDWPSAPCSSGSSVFNVVSVSRRGCRNMHARNQQPMAVGTPFPHQAWSTARFPAVAGR